MLKQTDNWYQDTFILGTKTVYDSYRGMAKQIEDSRDLIATVRGADANIAAFERCSFWYFNTDKRGYANAQRLPHY